MSFTFDMPPSGDQAAKAAQAFRTAIAHHEAGRMEEAEAGYRAVLEIDPKHLDAIHHLGILAYQGQAPEYAAEVFRYAISLDDRIAPFHSNLGLALEALGRMQEAAESHERAIALKPDFAEAWYNLGNARLNLGRLDEAEAAYNRSLALRPDLAEAYGNLGSVRRGQDRMDEALAFFDRALEMEPRLASAHFSRAETLAELGRLDEAVEASQRAIALWPDYAPAHSGLGAVYMAQGKLDAARAEWEQALELYPNYADARSNLLLSLNYRSDITAEESLAAHRKWDEAHGAGSAPESAPPANDRDPARRLKVGYVSGDFRIHPGGYFLAGVLPAHDPASVEVFCYSNSPYADDAMTTRIRQAVPNWRSIRGISEVDAAEMIRADGIDILVDLSGHTAHNRLRVFALKPAPVRASWLGYPNTTGLAAMDYLVTDAATSPPESAAWMSEALVRLPHGRLCYAPPAYAPEPAPPPSEARGYVTFGSFNNLTKVGPQVVRLWAAVLKAAPGSRLLLKWPALGQETTREGLLQAFAAEGIGAERLELRPYSPHEQMLGEYADMDVALDPFPFGGGLTSAEALWMGVPVVTLPGATPASRQTLAFLKAVDLEDLAAPSPEAYVERAVALAGDIGRRKALRAALRDRMAASPLTDGKAFVPALEAAYRQMWKGWTAGQTPAAFDV